MRLRDRLVFKPNKLFDMILLLQKTDRPVGLYGAGLYAKSLFEKLTACGISISFAVVDDKFLPAENTLWNGVPLMSCTAAAEKYPEAYILIAFDYSYDQEWDIMTRTQRKFSPQNDILMTEALWFGDFDWIDQSYIMQNLPELEKTYDMLEDELSKRIMCELINAKISGDGHSLMLFRTDDVNDYELAKMFADERPGAVVECGAFDGKSVLQTDAFCEGKRKIYALEPEPRTYDTLCEKTAGHDSIVTVKKGVSDREGVAYISGSGANASLGDEGDRIDLTTIDELMKNEPCAAITMDIEGSELAALKGAEKTILRDRPALGIRVYHRRDDLIAIPQYISGLFGGDIKYSLYLRMNGMLKGTYDVTLYAL
ncbi:MAG: FkbM family methyltransferase [Ruminococcus sp.]|nr:FkbM family methyltransferase [Ruminococcus sp.]